MSELLREKIIIPITECLPGMVLMQSVMDETTGNVILMKGHKLTSDNIDKLSNFNHGRIWVGLQEESSIWKIDEKLVEKYDSYATLLRGVIDQHKKGSFVSIELLISLSKDIIKDFSDQYELLACVNLMNHFNQDDYHHSINVAFLSLVMGLWSECSEKELQDLILAGLLHDVGKLIVGQEIIKKLDVQRNTIEKLEYRRHPIYGYEKLASYNELDVEVLKGVLSHHERCDGSGYPLSLKESKISNVAKIVGIADTYDRLKEKYNIFELVNKLTGTMLRKFEIDLLLEFCNNMINYYVGASVLLNTGEIAEVAFIQAHALGHPIIRLNDIYVNLDEKPELEIIKVL